VVIFYSTFAVLGVFLSSFGSKIPQSELTGKAAIRILSEENLMAGLEQRGII
jgi:hypothetical protein